MCGVVGFIDSSGKIKADCLDSYIGVMTDRLAHRGPDSGGCWTDANFGIALGHRRLSIIDLSAEGQQPMHSFSKRYVISYNGEVYNFQDIRLELESYGYRFRGRTDTEVLLNSIEHWGLEKAISKFLGMFAFALWDRQKQLLYLCRDRMGEKPLYYGNVGPLFAFASELKALTAHPLFDAEIDRQALALYFRYNYIPAPYSIYTEIKKLMPGNILTYRLEDKNIEMKSYWSLKEVAENASPEKGSIGEVSDKLEILLRDAIKRQMVADVPLGAFLSGGIDSSTIVSLMQAESINRVKTFTIGFFEDQYNEALYAKRIAEHLGTDHTELYLEPNDIMDVIPNLMKYLLCSSTSLFSEVKWNKLFDIIRKFYSSEIKGRSSPNLSVKS